MKNVAKESDFEALLKEGTTLFNRKSYVTAMKRLWLAFRIQPGAPEVLYNIGRVMEATDDPRMEDFYLAAANQGSVDALYQLAHLYLSIGDSDSAVPTLKAFIAAYKEEDEFSKWARETLDTLVPGPRLIWSSGKKNNSKKSARK